MSDRVAKAEQDLADARREAAQAREIARESSLSEEERAYALTAGIKPSRFALLKDVGTLDDWETVVAEERAALQEFGH